MPPQATVQPLADSDTEALILRFARQEPTLGQAAVAQRLQALGHRISPSGVRYIWQRHGLETAVKRLQALAEKDRDALTPDQQRMLERGQLSARLSAVAPASHAGGSGQARPLESAEPHSRQEMILQVAAELFASNGYDRTSIRDIARRAGLLPGSVYHHFPSKEDLFLAIYHAGFRRVNSRVNKAAARGNDPWECLRLACEAHVYGMVEGAYVERLTAHGLALIGDQALFDKIRGDREAYERNFKRLIDALPVRPGTDRSMLRLTLLGAMNWVAIWYRQGRRTPFEIAGMIVEMIRQGVDGAPPASD